MYEDTKRGGSEAILMEAPQGYEHALQENTNVTASNERDITGSVFQLLAFHYTSTYKRKVVIFTLCQI
jgi:hypothetical protein